MKTLPLAAALFAVTLDVSAAVRVGTPQPVTSSADLATTAAFEVQVASNGEKHYAIWRDEGQNAFGMLLERDGTPIASTRTAFTARALRDIDSSGTAFYVLAARIGSPALTVRRIEGDGTTGREVAVFTDPGAHAHIVASGTRIFVVYQTSDGPIKAFVLNDRLDLITNEFSITGSRRFDADFAIAAQGDQLLVTWVNDAQGAGAAFVDTRGKVTPLDLFIDATFSTPQLATNGTDYRLLWRDGNSALNVMFIDQNGKPGERLTLATGITGPFDIEWDGSEYWVAYMQQGNSCQFRSDVFLRSLSAPPVIISSDVEATSDTLRLVHTSDGFKFAVWSGAVCGDADTRAVGRLAFAGPINSFSLGVPDQITPSVVVANGVTLTTWREAGAIRAARPNQPSVIVAKSGSHPHIAFDGVTALILWLDDDNRILGRFLLPDLTFVGDIFLVATGADDVALDWSGGSYTAAWNTPGAASITTSGAVTLLPALLTTPTAGTPAVATNLVVWSEQVGTAGNMVSTILGRFVGHDEIFPIASVRAIPNAGNAGLLSGWSPRAACGPADCLVTWTQRNGPGRGTEGHAARVAFDGTLLDVNLPRIFFRNDSVSSPVILPLWDGTHYEIVANDAAHIAIGPFGGALDTVIAGKFFEFDAAVGGAGSTVIAYTQVTNALPVEDPPRRAFVIEADQFSIRRRPSAR